MNTTQSTPSRKLLSIVGIVALVILLSAVFFGWDHQKSKTVYVVELAGNALTVNQGDTFLISLESNPSTGFAWALNEGYDTNIVTFNGSDYNDNAGAAVGTPGTEDWSFTGIGKGETTLEFEYARSWETDVAPAQTQIYRINVK